MKEITVMSARSPFDLTGRTALVTGGNQGLGKAFAFGLAEAGAKVAIAGRSAERNEKVTAEAAAAGHTLHPITADITDSADVDRMTAEAIETLGHIDILVNNAGTCYHGESWAVTDEQWDAVFDLNVKALWACSLSVGAHMRDRGSGSVVNIGSMSGIIVNRPQMCITSPNRLPRNGLHSVSG
jgi:NAD(P)-dependent dehydrogenase (short-subunit alcohol dehydrogenase family)